MTVLTTQSDWNFNTNPRLVYFWAGGELVPVELIEDSLAVAARAADSLGARFFFKRVAYDRIMMEAVWGAFDALHFTSSRGTTKYTLKGPVKTFKTNNTAALVMWAAAKGGT